MKILLSYLFVLIGVLFCGGALAQRNVMADGNDMKLSRDGGVSVRSGNSVTTAGRGNEASVTVGGIEDEANIEGVSIINDRVSIDGKDVSPQVTRYRSPKTGKVYLIRRRGGSVSVSEVGEGK